MELVIYTYITDACTFKTLFILVLPIFKPFVSSPIVPQFKLSARLHFISISQAIHALKTIQHNLMLLLHIFCEKKCTQTKKYGNKRVEIEYACISNVCVNY